MTKEEIIRMADEADAYADEKLGKGEFHPDWHEVRDERFAQLVAAAERKYMVYASPHIWSTEAVKQERERLAQEIEKMPFGDTAASFAAWIRSQQ